jgi:hypothetical protein
MKYFKEDGLLFSVPWPILTKQTPLFTLYIGSVPWQCKERIALLKLAKENVKNISYTAEPLNAK